MALFADLVCTWALSVSRADIPDCWCQWKALLKAGKLAQQQWDLGDIFMLVLNSTIVKGHHYYVPTTASHAKHQISNFVPCRTHKLKQIYNLICPYPCWTLWIKPYSIKCTTNLVWSLQSSHLYGLMVSDHEGHLHYAEQGITHFSISHLPCSSLTSKAPSSLSFQESFWRLWSFLET